MITRVQAKDILLKYFVDNYGSTSPYVFDNESYDPPTESWVRFIIQNVQSDQVSLGAVNNRNFKRSGLISYQVFVLPEYGTYNGGILCDTINNIFEGKDLSGIKCEVGSWLEVGIDDNQAYYQFNGTIPFWFYEKR